MTNGIPILLFKAGSLALPWETRPWSRASPGHPVNLLDQIGALAPRSVETSDAFIDVYWEPTDSQGQGLQSSPIDDRLRPKLEAPLTKRQLKHRRKKDSKLNKEFKRLEADIDNLKSQMDSLTNKITEASESTNARFKRKKIRSMKRDFNKISEKLKESEAKLESVEQRVPIDLIQGAPLNYILPIKTNA